MSGAFNFSTGDQYTITDDGAVRSVTYLLGDLIYPEWPIFANPIHHPNNQQEQRYTDRKEVMVKDIKRCFGVLHSRF